MRWRGKFFAAAIVLVALLAGAAGWEAWQFHRADVEGEARRLTEILRLAPGMTFADVGAGRGRLSVAMARRLGPGGRVYATEVDDKRLAEIEEGGRSAGLDNIVVIAGGEEETGLPPGCCDAIVLRAVYHHLTAPASINRSLFRALRPNGTLAVIDFAPNRLMALWDPNEGIPMKRLNDELTAAGFAKVQVIEAWSRSLYCVIVRRPAAASDSSSSSAVVSAFRRTRVPLQNADPVRQHNAGFVEVVSW
jgi:SAM-dependent methyltransferase